MTASEVATDADKVRAADKAVERMREREWYRKAMAPMMKRIADDLFADELQGTTLAQDADIADAEAQITECAGGADR